MVDRSRAHPLTMGPGGDAVPCCAVPSRRAGCPQRGRKAHPKGRVAYVASHLGYSREEVSLEKTIFRRYIRYKGENPPVWTSVIGVSASRIRSQRCRMSRRRDASTITARIRYKNAPPTAAGMPLSWIDGHQKLQDGFLRITSVLYTTIRRSHSERL